MSKATLLRLLILFVIAPAFEVSVPVQAQESKPGPGRYFVAMGGNDAWSGTLPTPNRAKTDGPFASLERARDTIRKLKVAGAKGTVAKGGITVFVRGGVYSLSQTYKLGAEDSGTPDARIVYRSYGNEKPVLTGGHRVTGFIPYKGQIFKADLGAQGFKGIYFRQIFFNGKRQTLARLPNFDPRNPYGGGWSYVDRRLPWMMTRSFVFDSETPYGGIKPYRNGEPIPVFTNVLNESKRTFQVRPQDIHNWAHPEEGEVVIFPRYDWWNNIIRIASINSKTRTMTLASDASYSINSGDRYFVRNLFEELDSPSEWYLDRQTGTLYFWPPSDLKGGVVYAPTLETLVDIDGAANITLRGFTIECSEGTAINVRDSTNCLIAGNTIRNVGGRADSNLSAIAVDGGSHNGVVGNDIYEVGSNAIVLRGGDRKTLTASDHYADNNYIHHTGVYYKQGVGIGLSGVGNRASHNLIHDCPRIGIIFDGNDQIIEYNRIRHVSLETADTGAIYCNGRDWITPRGSIVRYNYLHDIIGYGRKDGQWISPYYAWGIYLDDNSSGVDVIGNIIESVSRGLVHLHNARDNVIQNNIFINGTLQQVELTGWRKESPVFKDSLTLATQEYDKYSSLPAWSKYRGLQNVSPKDAVPMANNKLVCNIFYYQGPSAMLYSYQDLPYRFFESDYNLIYHFTLPVLLSDVNKIATEQWWEEWQKLGFDRHSLVGDPLFVDPQKEDYRLRANSPAFKLGFKPIPVERIGPYQDTLRVTWPILEAKGARELLAK